MVIMDKPSTGSAIKWREGAELRNYWGRGSNTIQGRLACNGGRLFLLRCYEKPSGKLAGFLGIFH
jgi:hypothetical protein